jgi:segregation and condensation protein B
MFARHRQAAARPADRPENGLQDGRGWLFQVRREDRPVAFTLGGAHPDCIRAPRMARVEAILFVAQSALSLRRLTQLATLADPQETKQILDQLNRAYDRVGSAFRIESVAAGYQLLTRPQFAFWLGKLHQRQAELKLTPPALETLAIIAYRQPLTRAEIEGIRGVQCVDMIKQLMDRGLVRIGGEDNSLGRPFLYETTRQFLELFGLRSLDALPMAESLRKPRPSAEPASEDAEGTADAAAA